MNTFRILVFLLSFCHLCIAQERAPVILDDTPVERQVITEEDLDTYKTDKDFNYIEVEYKESFLDRVYRWFRNILRRFWEAIFGVGTASGFLYFVFRILPYILLGLLVFLLLRFFLKVNSNKILTKSKEKGSVAITEEEQIIKNEDIPALIREAIHQKNYRLAIRYYYLLSLKYLTENETISWQPQKTNEDYIKEIDKINLKDSFKNITRIYDYVWYGEFGVDALKFEALKQPFENLNKSIRTR
ncbi:DUF4129 domain-containing protein [Winogradskyella sp.]|uniref:DUF4129 domain-containing protein n=1 Tax=Winogradskyella sp. TaxID=1883156 RepID=UPI002605D775|nr:DUF4129 domain-containing protein [Winogradskyella sp.]